MLEINPTKEKQRIIAFIKDTLKKTGHSKLVIAISGGVDSATSLYLCVEAVGAGNVHPILLPYKDQSTQLAEKAIIKLNIPKNNITKINIANAVSAFKLPSSKHRLGNIMARVRMIYIFDHAKNLEALVCGTENKTEELLGYFTRFGDAASDLEPISHLYKTQVYSLAEHLSVPQEIIQAKPTAGLWQGQTDEGDFGFTYKQADQVLALYFDQHKSPEEIEKLIGEEITQKVLRRVKENSFKHQVPYKISNLPNY